MFERFTALARDAMVMALESAKEMKHGYIGTEHMLLGLLRDKDGVATKVLEPLGVTYDEVKAYVEKIVGQGDEKPVGQIPWTPKAKKVLELSLREALSLGHNHIGAEHVLLGLVRNPEGVAHQILEKYGLDGEKVRNEVIRFLMKQPDEGQPPTSRKLASVWVEQGAKFIVEITLLGYSGSVTVYHENDEVLGGRRVRPQVRVNVLWETLKHEQMNDLMERAAGYGFEGEFSKQYGLTFRPKNAMEMPMVREWPKE